MTKEELVRAIWAEAELESKRKAEEALDALLESVTAELAAGGELTLRDFGSFHVRERAARKGRNPQTGEEITIPAHKVVKFSPGKQLSELAERAVTADGADWLNYRRYLRSAEKQLDEFKSSVKKYQGKGFGISENYDTARTKLSDLANSSGSAWKELGKGFEAAYEELKSAFKKAAGKF